MRIGKLIGAAVGAMLVTTPLMAAGQAAKLSVARAGAPLQGGSALQDSDDNSGYLLAGAAAVAAAVAIYFLVDGGDDDDEDAVSP